MFLKLLFFVVLVIIVIYAKVSIEENKIINVDELKSSSQLVRSIFTNLSTNIALQEYKKLNKPTHTQKGDYRVDFSNTIAQKHEEFMKICCDFQNDCFTDDFRSFVNQNFQSVARKDLEKVVLEYINRHIKSFEEKCNQFINEETAITPEEFFDIKSKQTGDSVGVYIIYNQTKAMYYVGQAKRMFFRLNQHFTGHGNGDVYADYKYGDEFTIHIVKLSESGYSDIDKLEKDLIEKYNAFETGYNRTRGNK